MTMQELCNKIAGEIPEGWEILLRLSRESGSVNVVDPAGVIHEVPLDSDGIEVALARALEKVFDLAPDWPESVQ